MPEEVRSVVSAIHLELMDILKAKIDAGETLTFYSGMTGLKSVPLYNDAPDRTVEEINDLLVAGAKRFRNKGE